MQEDNRGIITAVVLIIGAILALVILFDVPVRLYTEKLTNPEIYTDISQKFNTLADSRIGQLGDKFIVTPLTYFWQQILIPDIINPLTEYLAQAGR